MFIENNLYGSRTIFSEYCKTKDKNAFAIIQHGLFPRGTEKFMANGSSFLSFIPFLCWNKRSEKILKNQGVSNAQTVGSSFVYLHELKKNKFKCKKKRGTLVFPMKSIDKCNRETNYDVLIKEVESKFNGPYTISIYYLDLKKDLTLFKKKNWKIISFGKRSDPSFLKNTYLELLKHKNVICTSLNTAFFYSAFLKKKTFLLLNSNRGKKININLDKYQVVHQKKIGLQYPGILHNRLSIAQLYNISVEELGASYIKTPKEISKILGWNNYLKIFFSWVLYFYYKNNNKNTKFIKILRWNNYLKIFFFGFYIFIIRLKIKIQNL